jgi:lipopolysaccharide transport system permease protein
LPFLIQILLFLTPVIYPISMVANYPWLQKALALNPMYAPISLIRNVLVDRPLEMEMVGVSIASGLVFLLVGILYFRKTESYFADLA